MRQILLSLSASLSLLYAQSFIEIQGTSTFHDWKMTTDQIFVESTFKDNKFTDLFVSFPIFTLKSGNERLDKNAYKALPAAKTTPIIFQLHKHHNQTFSGSITIGMEQKDYTFSPDIIKPKQIQGSLVIQMDDFKIKPPSFLLGAFSTGNTVLVKYNVYIP